MTVLVKSPDAVEETRLPDAVKAEEETAVEQATKTETHVKTLK